MGRHLATHLISSDHSRQEFRQKIVENDEVQMHWDGLSSCVDDEREAVLLLAEVVEMWMAFLKHLRGLKNTNKRRVRQYERARAYESPYRTLMILNVREYMHCELSSCNEITNG